MEKTSRYLFILLGFPGSGKSYVSRWLAPHRQAIHLRMDDLRLAMFKQDRKELYTPENKALVNDAGRYFAKQALATGQVDVILDGNNNTAEVRRQIREITAAADAVAVTVWVKTPVEVAKERTEIRKITEGHELFAPNLVETMAKNLEAPSGQELAIVLDGQVSQEEQLASFDSQLAALQTTLQ